MDSRWTDIVQIFQVRMVETERPVEAKAEMVHRITFGCSPNGEVDSTFEVETQLEAHGTRNFCQHRMSPSQT